MINISKNNQTVFENTSSQIEDIRVNTLEEARELFVANAKELANTQSIKSMKKDGFSFALDIHEWVKDGKKTGLFYANVIISYGNQRFSKRYQQAPVGSWNSETGKVFLNFQYKTMAVIYAVVKYYFGKLNAANYFPEMANYKMDYEKESIAI